MAIWVVDFPREGHKILKVTRFFAKKQHTQNKLLYFVNSDIVPSQQKLGIILENKVIAKSVYNKKKPGLLNL